MNLEVQGRPLLRLVMALGLLGALWLLPRLAATGQVPPGAEHQMWPPLRADLATLGLPSTGVRVDVQVMEFSRDDSPLYARYLLRGVNAARLNPRASWQAQGVPVRPARVWFLGKSRPGKAHDCPQNLAQTLPRGRGVESALLAWREQTPQGTRQATLTVWREARGRGMVPSLAGNRVCVESSRTRPAP